MTALTGTGTIAGRNRIVFGFLLAALLIETIFFVVLSPLLPVYARRLHLSPTGAAILNAGYSAGYGLWSLPAGVVVGRIGQRRSTLAGLALVTAGCAAFGVGHDAALLVAARVITGAGGAWLWSGALPWLLSLGGAPDRGRLIGLAFSATSVGSCLGPAIGALATVTGPRPAFVGLAGVIAAVTVAGAIAGRGHDPAPQVSAAGDLVRAVRAPGAPRALLMAALPTIAFGAFGVLLPLRLRAHGVSEVGITATYLVIALIEIGVNPRIGAWFDQRGPRRVLRGLLAAALLGAAALALPLPAGALVLVMIAALPLVAAIWVPALARLSDAVTAAGGAAGVALGLFNLTWAVVQVVGALGGAQLHRLGPAPPFLVLVALFGAGIWWARRLPLCPAARPGDGPHDPVAAA
jgi:predicted MFS family arabinose efflux permease